MPLHRRLPKRGFSAPNSTTYSVINVEGLNVFAAGDTVTPEILAERGLVHAKRRGIKVLGDGELKKPLKISAHRFSESALAKIQQAGGEAIVLPAPAPVVKNKMAKAKEGKRP